MITRTQQILVGLILVQLILAGLAFWPRGGADEESGPLLSELDPEQVTEIEIIDDAGSGVTLQRSGTDWVLASDGDYPVDAARVGPLLANLAGITTSRLVARSDGSHERLQVATDSFLRRVQLTTSAGDAFVLYLGSAPTASATHVRRGDSPETYLAPGLSAWEFSQQASGWVDTTYVSLQPESITAVSLENANGLYSFSRVSSDEWTLDDLADGELFNRGNFNLVLNGSTNLRFSRPLGKTAEPGYGLDSPTARLTFSLSEAGGTTAETLLIGTTDPTTDRTVVKWSGSEYYVEISAFALANLVEFSRESFLEQPEPEEETPES